ncbi:MAG TPA: acyltransferase [Candidatus Lokiarchaeia archaeon]|nr:acyltransferase [Candidatus Lokiarchaeia archaeon]
MAKKIRKAFTTLLLSIFIAIIIALVIDDIFSSTLGTWWDPVHQFLSIVEGTFIAVFYTYLPTFFYGIIIINFVLVAIFIPAYSITPKHRVWGTIISVFCSICWVIELELTMAWCAFGIIGSPEWTIASKIILLVMCFPLLLVFLFFASVIADAGSFLVDLVKERHEYSKIRYHIEREGVKKIVHFDMDGTNIKSIWSAIVYVLIDDILAKEGDAEAVSRFIRSSFLNVIIQVILHFSFWPRFKNMMYRFIGVKIGRDCLISQYARFDLLLPNLIIFENDSGVGIYTNLIVHTFQDRGNLRAFLYGPIRICKYARVAANVTITPGVTIGEGAIVAAGSLVNKDVPPYTMVGGVPAQFIKNLDPEEYRIRAMKLKRFENDDPVSFDETSTGTGPETP